MRAILQHFLLFLAAATERELARMVEYLKTENRILRDKSPKRINVTAPERRTLLKYGKRLGSNIREPHHDRVATYLPALAGERTPTR